MSKLKFSEYVKLTNEINELEIKQGLLKNQKESMEAEECFANLFKTKRVRLSPKEYVNGKELKQTNLNCFIDRTPATFINKLVKDLIEGVLSKNISKNGIDIENTDQKENTIKKVKVKCSYSIALKAQAVNFMKEHSVVQAYLHYTVCKMNFVSIQLLIF